MGLWLGNNGAVGDTDKGAEIGFVVILRRQPRLQNFGAIAATPISFQNPRKTWALLTKILSLKRNSPGH